MTCIFCAIIEKNIPSDIVYEDAAVVAFKDIHPKAPCHILVVPRHHIASLTELDENNYEFAGKFLIAIKRVADKAGVGKTGYRVVMNIGSDGGQEVLHLHAHVLGGKQL